MGAGCSALRDFGESPRAAPLPIKIKETAQVCHTLLHDPKLYTLLTEADEERAARVRAAGCFCGGVLHSARYPRKPRGIPPELRQGCYRRHSFCCNLDGCRSRHTPQSVFYLGRRVYLGAVMLLATAMRCQVSGRALRQVCEVFGVTRATVDRWRVWWNRDLLATPFWKAAAGGFMPPVSQVMPAGLLARFTATEALAQLLQALRFLAPLSTLTEVRSGAIPAPHKFGIAGQAVCL